MVQQAFCRQLLIASCPYQNSTMPGSRKASLFANALPRPSSAKDAQYPYAIDPILSLNSIHSHHDPYFFLSSLSFSANFAVSCCSSPIVSFAFLISPRSAFTWKASSLVSVSQPRQESRYILGQEGETYDTLRITRQLVRPLAMVGMGVLQLILLLLFDLRGALVLVFVCSMDKVRLAPYGLRSLWTVVTYVTHSPFPPAPFSTSERISWRGWCGGPSARTAFGGRRTWFCQMAEGTRSTNAKLTSELVSMEIMSNLERLAGKEKQ